MQFWIQEYYALPLNFYHKNFPNLHSHRFCHALTKGAHETHFRTKKKLLSDTEPVVTAAAGAPEKFLRSPCLQVSSPSPVSCCSQKTKGMPHDKLRPRFVITSLLYTCITVADTRNRPTNGVFSHMVASTSPRNFRSYHRAAS